MSDKARDHRDAAARHEQAAENHQRAAGFWHARGDAERAGLQSEMAAYERTGAELERRWAELTEGGAGHGDTAAADLVVRHTRQSAKRASGLLARLADTLQTSAQLADEHARRLEQTGGSDPAQERWAAQHAREAAQRARSQAEQWLKLVREHEG